MRSDEVRRILLDGWPVAFHEPAWSWFQVWWIGTAAMVIFGVGAMAYAVRSRNDPAWEVGIFAFCLSWIWLGILASALTTAAFLVVHWILDRLRLI